MPVAGLGKNAVERHRAALATHWEPDITAGNKQAGAAIDTAVDTTIDPAIPRAATEPCHLSSPVLVPPHLGAAATASLKRRQREPSVKRASGSFHGILTLV